MKLLSSRLLTTTVLLLIGTLAGAAPGGSLPLKINTGVVEQAPRWGDAAPAYRRQIDNPERLQAAIDAQMRHTEALMRDNRARGTAVGWNDNEEPVVKVYVDADSSEAGIPERLDGIPVVVEYTGKLYALNVPCEEREAGSCSSDAQLRATAAEPGSTERHPRPVPIGVSTGHIDVTAGTIGCRVNAGCHSYVLSNAHVIADINDGNLGDNILQPGVYDGGINPDDRIANLFLSIPIVMSASASNTVDAAIAGTNAGWVDRSTPSDGYGTPRYSTLNPTINLNVMKYGRTTQMTYGYIDALNATLLVDYDGTNARFVGQIIVKEDGGGDFSLPGDSGALLVASGGPNARRPVGLLFAAGGGISAANPISDVLSELGVTIDGE